MINHFGSKIKLLRESSRLLQRHVAEELLIDTPMLSKIENGDRRAKKEQIQIFASLFRVPHEELLTLWLADLVLTIVDGEELGSAAIQLAESKLKDIHLNHMNMYGL